MHGQSIQSIIYIAGVHFPVIMIIFVYMYMVNPSDMDTEMDTM